MSLTRCTHGMKTCDRFQGFVDCSETADANIKQFLNELGNVYSCLWLYDVMAQLLLRLRKWPGLLQEVYHPPITQQLHTHTHTPHVTHCYLNSLLVKAL